jgi:glycosyltransferase involved in cell wall biosynthesis
MKILMLTPYLPYPLLSGGQIRTYNLLKKLAHKHEITLFALIKDDSERQYVAELEKYCKKVKVFNRSKKPFTIQNVFKALLSSHPFLVIRNHAPHTIKAIEEELSQNHYDLIHAETFYMMPHLPRTTIPTILVEQTIEYLGYESYAKKAPFFLKPLLQLDINKIKKWEKYYWRKCHHLIVMSQDDQNYIEEQVEHHAPIDVVSNGVDIEWFNQKKRELPTVPTILSVGTFNWLPNVEAVNFLVRQVWPKIKTLVKNAKLKIVGNNPTQQVFDFQKTDTQIEVIGRIPDIRDAFKKSHVLVAPVFSGKGTRYKILEAMASGTPVVATSIAVEGLAVQHRKHVLTSNTAEGLAELTAEVLQDPKLWESLSKTGYQFVMEQYNWDVISKKLDTIYQQLGARHRDRTK